jgi:hypothetical protein
MPKSPIPTLLTIAFISISVLGLSVLDPALAKGGKTKNAQHGRGEAFRGQLERLQNAGLSAVTGKRNRVKEAKKHRNMLKTLGKAIRGENHSMKSKR